MYQAISVRAQEAVLGKTGSDETVLNVSSRIGIAYDFQRCKDIALTSMLYGEAMSGNCGPRNIPAGLHIDPRPRSESFCPTIGRNVQHQICRHPAFGRNNKGLWL